MWARRFGGQDKWVSGTVRSQEDSRRYILDSGNGQVIRRHIDQIRPRSRARMSDIAIPNDADDANDGEAGAAARDPVVDGSGSATSSPPRDSPVVSGDTGNRTSVRHESPPKAHSSPAPQFRYPQRIRKPVTKYGLEK